MLRRYLAAIDTLALQRARIAVLPETVFAVDRNTIPELAERAKRHGMFIDVGIATQDPAQGERNMALALSAMGLPQTYAKHHLIPGFEDLYHSGTAYAMVPGLADTGMAICKDMDFHDTGAAYSECNARLLLVPAWDFVADDWLHGRMAVMRGVESGFAIARSARMVCSP